MAEDLRFLARAVGIARDGPAPAPVPEVLDDPALRCAAKGRRLAAG